MMKKLLVSPSFSSTNTIIVALLMVTVMTTMISSSSAHDLSTGFYSNSCPKLFTTVRSGVKSALAKEKRMGASLVRLFFHDCFVQGCDGSILLDDTSSFRGEKTALPNNNSIRGYEVIDKIKAKVERVCPGVVSCADIVAVAARDSVLLLGGPGWDVKVGRRDSKTASLSSANSGRLPGPTSSLSNLITRFQTVGLSARDMVALSGAHTIGQARCITFRNHIYNETNINPSFAKLRQRTCPRTAGQGNNKLAPLDFQTPNGFDTKYFQNLLGKKGLLHSDQVLYDGSGGLTDSLVVAYSKHQSLFYSDFVKAMIKMGDINPLTGSNGEIRKNCRRLN